MKSINILDEITINKIAAGEVVERPASVIKELIENAIDASCTSIVVEIVDGGKSQIKITDNGEGIASSEVEKCFMRHATSKIKEVNDLYKIESLGFRGEAMSSIAAVSRIEMKTKYKDESIGTRISIEGGKIKNKEAIGAPQGTSILIKDLFFNTPARFKFLKSSHSETINISDLINKLAIGNSNIRFKYINNNKIMLNTPGDERLENAIRSVHGRDVIENLIDIDFKSKYFEASGYISNNNLYRSNKTLQYIYVNNRFVKSTVIMNSISEAYKSIIPIGKHAICFIRIKLNPNSLDVNIHPSKLEVKFENESQIYTELKDYLKQRLLSSNLIGKYAINELQKNNYETTSKKMPDSVLVDKNLINQDISILNKDKLNNVDKDMPTSSESKNTLSTFKLYKDVISGRKDIDCDCKKSEISAQIKDNLLVSDFKEDYEVQGKITRESSIEYVDEKESKTGTFDLNFNEYEVLGVIFKTYIVLLKGESMYLLDQHAAHERVLFEKYMDKFKKQSINMQLLLDPIVMQLSNVDMLKIENNIEFFMRFGFEVEIYGNNSVIVRSVPNLFGAPESEKFIIQIIDNFDEISSNYDLKSDKIASMSCKSAIKANDSIGDIDINSLFEQLEKCKNPFTCPHGRPIIVEISKKEIEKMFKRIM